MTTRSIRRARRVDGPPRQSGWMEALAWVDDLAQAGPGVDPKMRETIAAFRLAGFATFGSCEGHPERPETFPYIGVQAASTLARLSPSERRARVLKAADELSGDERERLAAQSERDLLSNQLAAATLRRALEAFYASAEGRRPGPRLELAPMLDGAVLLRASRARPLSSYPLGERAQLVAAERAELQRFGRFLR